jgi:hypothetical protein
MARTQKRQHRKLDTLFVATGVLLWAVALYLALRPDYQPVPGVVAGLLGAVLIEAGWARRGASA